MMNIEKSYKCLTCKSRAIIKYDGDNNIIKRNITIPNILSQNKSYHKCPLTTIISSEDMIEKILEGVIEDV